MQTAEEAFTNSFYGLPSATERARMSPEELAILLSRQEAGSPTYILVEHELNMRIAKIQSMATERAAWVGVVGVVAGVVLTTLIQAIATPTLKAEPTKAPPTTVQNQTPPQVSKP